MLGRDVSRVFTEAKLTWIGTGREVDVTDPDAIAAFANSRDIGWVVNCTAYTAVDKAEDEPDACRRLNAEAPAHLARWAAANGAAILHVSTDYVFAGEGDTPYREDDAVGPRSVYGAAKAEGEAAVRALCPRHLIVRTAWLYGGEGPNFVYTMLRLMRTKEQLGVVDDQRGAPTWTADLARCFPTMMENSEGRWGIYHASGEGQCTWFGFAQAILEEGLRRGLVTRPPQMKALTTAEYPTKARRPAWSVLSKVKLKTEFGLEFRPWRDSLNAFLDSPLDPRRFS
jgi:dTDP-4-dehydrorhamnose reductase